MYPNVHCSTIYNSWDMEPPRCSLTDEWIKKLWYIYKKEQIFFFFFLQFNHQLFFSFFFFNFFLKQTNNKKPNLNSPPSSLPIPSKFEPVRWMNLEPIIAEWCRSEREKQIWYNNSYMESRKMVLMNLVESRLVDLMGEGKGGMNWESSINIYTLICVK